jgi:hypothetical protein
MQHLDEFQQLLIVYIQHVNDYLHLTCKKAVKQLTDLFAVGEVLF